MYIKKLQLLNFQVIENFEAEFDGNVYFITGDNELGKSTLLKAIGALLTGNRDDVLRNGASKGFAKMVVGDDGEEYEVALSFTEANPRGTLTIKQKTTGMQTNNVSMLARIFGYQDFDAVEFSRWSETADGRRKQIAVVKSLLSEAVRNRIEEIDQTVAELKAERTGVNRDVKNATALWDAARVKAGTLDRAQFSTPVDISEMVAKAEINAKLAEKAKTARNMLDQRTEQLAAIPGEINEENARYERTVASIARKVDEAKAAYEKAKADAEAATKEENIRHETALAGIEEQRRDLAERKANAEQWLAKYEANRPENEDTATMLARAKDHNEKVELVRKLDEKERELAQVTAKAKEMDFHIIELGTERANLIANAELPIDGLSFSEDGLTLNGIPFVPGKVSDSQTMEIAAKLVIASNPTVKVFRIARGESLGEKRLRTIVDIARKNGFQGFIEQVQRGQTEMMVEEYTER